MSQPVVQNGQLIWPTNATFNPQPMESGFISTAGNIIGQTLNNTLEVAGQLLPIWTANTLSEKTGQPLYAPTYQGTMGTTQTTAPPVTTVESKWASYMPIIAIGGAVLVAALLLRK